MTNNKFKKGDRVEYTHKLTYQVIQGEIIDISGDDLDQTIVVHWIQHYNSDLNPSELTLIDSTPEETSNLPDDNVKGFNPEKLTFDGIEIKAGDEIKIGKYTTKYLVIEKNGTIGINIDQIGMMGSHRSIDSLECFNITAHFPAKSELEEAKKETKIALDIISEAIKNDDQDDMLIGFDRYYQARKRLEEYKSNNK